jgi:hypothetical protein
MRIGDRGGETITGSVVRPIHVMKCHLWTAKNLLGCSTANQATAFADGIVSGRTYRSRGMPNVDAVVAAARATREVGCMHRVIFASLVAVMATASCTAPTTVSTSTRPTNSHWQDKAIVNASDAERRVGGFNADSRAAYRAGVQYIRTHHQEIGAFTIAQVIEAERGRRRQRGAAAFDERQRREAAREAARTKIERQHAARAGAVAAAAADRAVAEEKHLQHGEPSCLVLDDRTLTSSRSDYTSYLDGKVQNQCDRSMRYISVHFTFFDDAGNQIGSDLTNVNDVAAGTTWAFHKPVFEHRSMTWRVEKIIGY